MNDEELQQVYKLINFLWKVVKRGLPGELHDVEWADWLQDSLDELSGDEIFKHYALHMLILTTNYMGDRLKDGIKRRINTADKKPIS